MARVSVIASLRFIIIIPMVGILNEYLACIGHTIRCTLPSLLAKGQCKQGFLFLK